MAPSRHVPAPRAGQRSVSPPARDGLVRVLEGAGQALKHLRRGWWSRAALRRHMAVNAGGYGVAVLGVVVASAFVGVVEAFAPVANISLIYLFVVLALATRFGRWPAVLASLLAFLAYDFFFIPPFHQLTVDDPTQWLSLAALLVTSLVLGQLTAAVEARRREAVESQGRTATLYALAQLIASTTGEQALLDALARRLALVFASAGVEACALILPDETAELAVQAIAGENGASADALGLHAADRMARARSALVRGCSAAGRVSVRHDGMPREVYWRYVPLRSGERIVGVLAIAGSAGVRRLRVDPDGQPKGRSREGPERRAVPRQHRAARDERDARAALFAAFCDQIALALERAALRRQAIHAEAVRESDRLKTALLGLVTHDLRTPLASIKAAATGLLERDTVWSEADRREVLDSINVSVDRLNRVVSNLLDLSRLEGGAATPEKEWCLIGDVLATALDRLELGGHLRDHRVEVEIPPDVPLAPMDGAQIERVFTNLLENAVKYSPDGSVIRVVARVTPTQDLEVRVTDQGIGVPAGELRSIFDRFYRVPQARLPWTGRSPTGAGLGLAICAGIIRQHDGRIWAESAEGEGSEFTFTLPIPDHRPRGSLPEVGSIAPWELAPTAHGSGGQPGGEMSQNEARP